MARGLVIRLLVRVNVDKMLMVAFLDLTSIPPMTSIRSVSFCFLGHAPNRQLWRAYMHLWEYSSRACAEVVAQVVVSG